MPFSLRRQALILIFPFLLAGLTACGSDDASEEASEQAGFVTMLGDDTLAVERFRHTETGMEAEVVLRTPETRYFHYQLDLGDGDGMMRYEAVAHRPGAGPSDPPLRRVVVVPVGDSLRVDVTEEGQTQTRMLSAGPSALPFIDMVHWPFEVMLRRAHAAGAQGLTQPLFTEQGMLDFRLAPTEEGTMAVTHPTRGTMQATTDGQGRLLRLDAGETTRKLIVRRVEDADVDALSQRFAARDAAGRPFGPLSGRGETTALVDGATLRVDYGQPSKRGRLIFGGLVPWGEHWRTGADRATHFETNRLLQFGDLAVPAGLYTLYTLPQPDGGLLIFNRQTGQGGTTYDAKQDLGRVPMARRTLAESIETFTIAIEPQGEGGILSLRWDTTAFEARFHVIQ